MQRKPPEQVCKALREEVNYGCPICGSPFLTWHHFDPPWREHPHHDPEGMIALCANHAQMADADIFAKDQLKNFKKNPCTKHRIIRLWPWEPEKLVFLMGGSIFLGVRPLLTLQRKVVFGATRVPIPSSTAQSIVFNLDLVDPYGNPIIDMKENLLTIHTNQLRDFRFTCGAKKFVISHISGLKLGLQFHRYLPHDFQRHLSDVACGNRAVISFATDFAEKHSLDSDGLIPVVELGGRLFNNDVTMNIEKRVIELQAHFFADEKVTLRPRCFSDTGTLTFELEGQGQILRFG